MVRRASQAVQSEYDELKKFFVHWEKHLNPVRISPADHPSNPINTLAWLESQLGISKALSGLKQAINDILESVPDYTPTFLAQADASLAAAGALTLTQLWQRRSTKFNQLLRRGKLRNNTEYYLASSILADTASTLSAQDRDALNNMVASYELQRA